MSQFRYNYTWNDGRILSRTEAQVISAIYQTKYAGVVSVANKGLLNNVSEISGVQRVGGPVIARFVKGKSPIISPSKNIDSVTRWVFKLANPKATVVAFKTGTLQVTTKEDIETVRAFLDRTYFPGVSGFKVNKLDGQFFVNFPIKVDKLYEALSKHLSKNNFSYQYEPELVTWGTLRLGDFKYKLFRKGLVQFSGDAQKAPELFMKTLSKIPWPEFTTGDRYTSPKKNVQNKAAIARERYQRAMNYNDTMPGFYVRPGPNGLPRFYPIPTNKAPIRMKVLRAYMNANKNIPNSVKKLFNLEGLELKEKEESKAAPSFSATKNGFYVKPGKGGAPFFYKVPKDTKAAKARVIKAYKNASKPVPQAVRNIFKITNTNTALKETNLYVSHRVNKVNNRYRINGVLASNYTVPQLIEIARNLKIARASSKMTAAQLTQVIVNKLGTNKKPHAVVNGVPHTLLFNGRVMRGTRAKQWDALTRPEKDTIAKAILSTTNFTEWKGVSAADQYQTLLAVVSKSPSPKTPVPRSVSSTNSFERQLEQALLEGQKENYKQFIKNSLGKYQSLATNQNAKNLEKLVNNLPKGKRGKPMQVDVDRVKLHFIKELKARRQLENIRKRYRNSIVVPSNLKAILKNKVNEYKNVLTSLGTQVNNKGKLPKEANVKRGIIAWVRDKFPRRVKAAAPYEVENMVTGQKRMVYPSPPSPNRKTPNVPKLSVKRVSPLKVKRRSPAYKRPRKEQQRFPIYSPKSLTNIKQVMQYYGLNAARNSGWTVQEFIDAVKLKNKTMSENALKNMWNAEVVMKHPATGAAGRIKR